MDQTTINSTNVDILDLGTLQTEGIGELAKSGLVYLLRDYNTGEQLMPPVFCKDFFQEFAYTQITGEFPNKDSENNIYGFEVKKYPQLLNDNQKLNLLLFGHTKTKIVKIEDYFGNSKVKQAYECILNTNVIRNFINQLNIFETQLIKLGYINSCTEIEVKEITYKLQNNNTIIPKNLAISLNFDKCYFYKPELLSLYLLLLRNFLTATIFVGEVEDLDNFLLNISKYKLSYIYPSDAMVFNNPNIKLNLPLYLKGKYQTTDWSLYKNQNISTIHNSTGILSYLSTKLFPNVKK